MHDKSVFIQNRLVRMLGERIRPALHRPVGQLRIEAWHVDGGQGEPVPAAQALAADYLPFQLGDTWGPAWGTTWFHLTGQIPDEAAGQIVEAVVDLGWQPHSPGFQAEGLVYRPDGSMVKGLNPLNGWVPLANPSVGGEEVDLYIEAAANPMIQEPYFYRPTALGEKDTAGPAPMYRLVAAHLAVLEQPVQDLIADLEVLDGLSRSLLPTDPRRFDILAAVDRSLDRIVLTDVPGSAAAARSELVAVLASPAAASAHRLSAVGHAHIDSAWLWPVRETVRKVARTIANVLHLLDTHPDLIYAMSSAQQYEWVEHHYPDLFARLTEHIAGGRFVPVGGMWVESDTNLVGGEAMARQFVYGKRYFLDRFGVECEEVWLPDSFGYSASLPQIAAAAGFRWMLTQKISWNKVNAFPHHAFWWEGIDGTRMFTHFPPVDTYNSDLSGLELAHAVANFRDKGHSSQSLVPFGWGDGGGGPTREMIARARRTEDLEGSPRVTIRPPADFFRDAAAEYPDAPVWVGELYLEIHRGTYTSQARTKHGNRRSEHLLREAELWSATAAARNLLPYPYDRLDRIWKLVLLQQFHDILPGSSIAWVHREAAANYAAVAAELQEMIGDALTALSTGDLEGNLEFNATPFAVNGVPALSAGPAAAPSTPVDLLDREDATVLDNGQLKVVIDRRGVITSILDLRADREIVPAGSAANLLQLHTDFPNEWDAWDIDEHYRNTVHDLIEVDNLTTSTDASGRATVTVTRGFGASHLIQTITLAPSSTQVDCAVDVQWHEHETLLKVAFPVDVHTDHADFEIQFGYLTRPTHQNTSWDQARFEVSAHRWVRVSEPGYGVAVVNDATYGHDITRRPAPAGGTSSTIRLSLLRGPRYPDPDADQGRHVLNYAIVADADIQKAAHAGYAINLPPRAAAATNPVPALVSLTGPGVAVIEAVKLADDRSGDVIVRLYEPLGAHSTVHLQTSFPATEIFETDLLERRTEPLSLYAAIETPPLSSEITLRMRPFQLVTVRVRAA